jgi:hypothetical protein
VAEAALLGYAATAERELGVPSLLGSSLLDPSHSAHDAKNAKR